MVEGMVMPSFRRSHLVALLIIFVLGALGLWYASVTHPKIESRVDVLSTRQMNVLVAVHGTPLNPGFLGFVAAVKTNSHILKIEPVSGLIPVTVGRTRMPLYEAVSDLTPQQATKLVSKASGIPIGDYFYINGGDLTLVLNALYSHTPNWPKTDTPLIMLQGLGYPASPTNPKEQIRLVRLMANRLPSVTTMAALSLLSITKTASTNLSSDQIFLLGNYVRGDQLVQGLLTPHTQAHQSGRRHG